MKKKKIFSFLAAALMTAGVASAQDINKAIELANNGMGKVHEGLGDVKMTANIYAHLDTARKSSIADSLANRFGAA